MSAINDHYAESITRVLKYIDANLEADLSVAAMADIALFSKFHFHRVFKGVIGETLNAYVNRRRLERAAGLLKRRPELSVTHAALEVGFQSPEHFSRLFKERYGVTAREFRLSDPDDPTSLKNSKMYQEVSSGSFYHVYIQSRTLPSGQFEVVVREQPEYTVASITGVFGDDGTDLVAAYDELINWAEERDLIRADSIRFAISRDDIEITPAEQYRMEFCLSVPEGTTGGGKIAIDQVWGGSYALIPVRGDIHQVAQAWDYLYKEWLPTSAYLPEDQPAIEIFVQGPETTGWETFHVEIGIPVRKVR